jgi:hypothetical protein
LLVAPRCASPRLPSPGIRIFSFPKAKVSKRAPTRALWDLGEPCTTSPFSSSPCAGFCAASSARLRAMPRPLPRRGALWPAHVVRHVQEVPSSTEGGTVPKRPPFALGQWGTFEAVAAAGADAEREASHTDHRRAAGASPFFGPESPFDIKTICRLCKETRDVGLRFRDPGPGMGQGGRELTSRHAGVGRAAGNLMMTTTRREVGAMRRRDREGRGAGGGIAEAQAVAVAEEGEGGRGAIGFRGGPCRRSRWLHS